MVVLVVDVYCVWPSEPERDAPVGIDADRPPTCLIAGQSVQTEAGQCHVLRIDGNIEPSKKKPQAIGMMSGNSCFRSGSKEQSQSFVCEGAYQV